VRALRTSLVRLGGDRRGVTAVEFGIILAPLCITLLGLTDLGYRSYVASIVQGALHEASRMATVGDKTGAQIDAHVQDRLKEFSKKATVTITKQSYAEYSNVAKAEKITSDTAPVGSYNAGDCFEDANANGKYDTDQGKTGLGGAEDIVNYKIDFTFPRLVPLGKFLGWSDTETISASTVLRNQPYAARSSGTTVLCI
jgi:Flp pilus assembly pilin Flp